MTAGTAHYPTDADPPFAGIAICPGFLNTGPEMAAWGTFYASYGIVTVVTNTLGGDFPDVRARKLLAAIEELERLNSGGSGPLAGKMAGRYGTSGYSMGGGGTTLATRTDKTLMTSVGLAAWGPNGTTVQTPTLLLCGESDTVAPCSGSQNAYNQIPNTTPKMLISIPLLGHLSWFGPNDTSGGYALAFQKVFLDGDERWKALLLRRPTGGSYTTNIQ
jgi:pimeloyl-ACP methyl ester carboxylesterase